MKAAPLTTPQMWCPKCNELVRVTKSGAIRLHARTIYVGNGREVKKRCAASGTAAPADGYRKFLATVVDDRTAILRGWKSDEAAALRRLEELREGRVAAEAALAEAVAALDEVSK